MSDSAVVRRVLWNQLPEFVKGPISRDASLWRTKSSAVAFQETPLPVAKAKRRIRQKGTAHSTEHTDQGNCAARSRMCAPLSWTRTRAACPGGQGGRAPAQPAPAATLSDAASNAALAVTLLVVLVCRGVGHGARHVAEARKPAPAPPPIQHMGANVFIVE